MPRWNLTIHPNWEQVKRDEPKWYLDTPRENADIIIREEDDVYSVNLRVNDRNLDKIATGYRHKTIETMKITADEIASIILHQDEYTPLEAVTDENIDTAADTLSGDVAPRDDLPDAYVDSITDYIYNEYSELDRVSNGPQQPDPYIDISFGPLDVTISDTSVFFYTLLTTAGFVILTLVFLFGITNFF